MDKSCKRAYQRNIEEGKVVTEKQYFYLDAWKPDEATPDSIVQAGQACNEFYKLCAQIKESFEIEWRDDKENMYENTRLQKEAIIGMPEAVIRFKENIKMQLRKLGKADIVYPDWYETLIDGIFHENWGLAGVAEFFTTQYADSSSAKVIGDKVYFMQNGRQRLMPQRISKLRRQQLVRALCLDNPAIRFDSDYHEVFMNDGSRITIYNESMTQRNSDAIVIRRYILPNYTFEMHASKGTISYDMILIFKSMVRLGYNVIFSGAPRTAKTSMLATWLSYEDSSLEGVLIGTDEELDLGRLLPDAPVLTVIAEEPEKLKKILPSILRSDADYLCFPEARDGISLDTAVTVASKGTRRMKLTFHARDPYDLCYDIATEIGKYVKGSISDIKIKVAKSFDYIFHMVQLKDKSQKRLKGIYEICYDRDNEEIQITQICRYVYDKDSWEWNFHISNDKREAGEDEDKKCFREFELQFKELAEKYQEKKEGGNFAS